jgi:competence protein ComEC
MRRPLLIPALAFAAGIASAELGSLPVSAGLVLAAIALAGTPWSVRTSVVWVGVGFFAAGILAWRWSEDPVSPDDLRWVAASPPQLAAVRGFIAETPEFRLAETHGVQAGRTLVRIQVRFAKIEGRWARASGTVAATVPGALPSSFFRTQAVEVEGVLDLPPGPAARGLFDYRGFLARQGVWRTLRTDGPEDWALWDGGTATRPMSERFLPWAREALARGLPKDESTGLFAALALGWKTPLTETVDDPYLRSGTVHVFAVSGLHVAMVAWMMAQVLQMVRAPRAWAGMASLPLAWFYIAATGWQASAVRAGVMATAILAGGALKRPSDLLNSLSGAALAVLAWSPGQLFQAGFQLSFVAVAGIGTAATPLKNLALRVSAYPNAPLLPREMARWPAWAEAAREWLAANVALGGAALLSTLPLTIHWFHVVSLVSLGANLLVVPVSIGALASALASLVVGIVSPWAGGVFNAAGWALVTVMTAFSKAFASVPGGHWFSEAPDWRWWIPYYAVFAAGAAGWLRLPRRRWVVGFVAGGWLMAAGLVRLGRKDVVSVTVLSGGEAELVTGAGDRLFDTGDTNSAVRLIIPLLRARGVNSLAAVTLVRPDVRHGAGIGTLLDALPVRDLEAPTGSRRWPGGKAFINALEARGRSVSAVEAGARTGPLTVLLPDGEAGARADSGSLAIAGRINGVRVIWTGSMTREEQRRVAELAGGETDIIISGETPDGEPWTDGVWDSLKPKCVVLSGSKSPASKRLGREARERWRAHGAVVLFTGDTGSIELEFSNGSWRAEAVDGTVLASGEAELVNGPVKGAF